ncbi:MAG: twin-arginine translocation signal domain-containing protein, partial [Bacteroidota bacterium]
MENSNNNRRNFLKKSSTAAAGLMAIPMFQNSALGQIKTEKVIATKQAIYDSPRINFSVIGMNHGHIYSQVEAVKKGGGQLVSYFAKEADLIAVFAKRYPDAKLVKDEKEILDDKSIQLVLSSAIASERAPLGIRVMKSGKDFMSDKPGITTLEQLAKVRNVQKATGRIYSIMYSERFENKATVKAGELVKAGAIGNVIQTIGLGPHRMSPKTRPEWFFDKDQFGG